MNKSFRSPIPSCPPARETRQIVACLDRSEQAARVMDHAFAIGQAMDAPVTLLQVLETGPEPASRPDPIEWDLRRREARALLDDLARSQTGTAQGTGVQLAEGAVADAIVRFAEGNRENLLVLGMGGGGNGSAGHCIGATLHDVLEHTFHSVLLVPTGAAAPSPGYRRIVVPLDGSPWAESAVPLAVRLARASSAELVLAHVVPSPELTEPRPLEPEDIELRRQVIARNEAAARDYLERLRRQLAMRDIAARVVLRHGENVRRMLARIVATEQADLVILSARGHGSCEHSDVRYGSVASYLMTHAPVPVLVARPQVARAPAEAALIRNPQPTRTAAFGFA
ncbi:MAG: hypothetical protein RIQ46_2084 [Pseudomonadota bacterium]|jgi:nucleotide-binding universal stress UspA family protein